MTPVTLLTLTVGTATYRYADVQTDAYPAHAPRLAGPADLEEAAATPLTRSLPVRRARVRLSNVALPHYATTAPTVSQILGAGQDVVGAQASVQVADADTQTVLTTMGGYVEEISALSLSDATLVVSDALAGDASTLLPCALTDLFPSVQAPEGTALAVILGTARRVRLYPVSQADVVTVTYSIQASADPRGVSLALFFRDQTYTARAGDALVYEVWRDGPHEDVFAYIRLNPPDGPERPEDRTRSYDIREDADQNGVANNAYEGIAAGCQGWYRRVIRLPDTVVGWRLNSWRLAYRRVDRPLPSPESGTARFARFSIVGPAGETRAVLIGRDFALPHYNTQRGRGQQATDTIVPAVDPDAGYSFGAWRTGTGVSVANAYLNGRRMASTEYTVVSPLPGVSAIKLTLEDDRPPPDGAVVHADFTSTEFAGNPAKVTEFFLSHADHGLGRAVNATQFTAAAAAFTARKLTVGGAVTKRTPAATLLQEFLLHGAVLTHGSGPGGPIGMQVDAPGTQAALELGHADETGWRNFTPANAAPVRAAAQPKSLLVRGVLDPGFAGEPERWLATTKRSRTFPRGAEHDVAYRYVVDPDSLDRQAHYLWEQMQAQATPLTGDLNVTEPDAYALDVGDRLVVTVPGLGLARADYRIGGFRNRGAQFGLTLHPYRAAAFVYAAGTDREIEPQARELVDYSRTQPQAPTHLVLTADALRTLTNGEHEVSVTASVTAPAAPVDQIYFKLVKTGGVAPWAEATVPCTPGETAVSATLRAESGEAYTVEAYAEMSTNDAGFRRGDAVTATATAVVDPDATLTPGRPGFNAVVDLPLYTGGAGTLDLVGEWHAAGVASTDTAWPARPSLTLVTAIAETRDQLLSLRAGHHVALFDTPDRWVSGTLTAAPTSVEFTASSQTRWRVTLTFQRDSAAGFPNFSAQNRGAQLNYSVPAPHPATQAEIWIKTPWSDAPAAPPTPTGDATFTWQSGAVTGLTAGWTADVPATGGAFLWRVRAPIPEGWGDTYTISPAEWQIPRRISHDGLSYVEVSIYKAQGVGVAAPARPTGGSYHFATRTLTPPAGWSAPPGLALGADQRLYVCAATAHDGAGDTWHPVVGDPDLISQSVAIGTSVGGWVSADLTGDPAVTTAAAPATVGPEPPSGRMFVAKGKAAEDRRTERNAEFGGNRLDITAYLRGSGDPSGSALQIGARFDYADDRTATTRYLSTDADVLITAVTDNRWTKVAGSIPIPAGADRITPRIAFTGTGVADSATINFGDVFYTVRDLDAWTTPRRAEQAAAVNMVYKRSPSQPAALTAGPDRTPTGTSDSATSAPGSGRLWENFGIRPPEAANWTWGGWRKAEGLDGRSGGTGPTGPPGPEGTTPSVVAYAYGLTTSSAQPGTSLRPDNDWATNASGSRGTQGTGPTAISWYADRRTPTRTKQYLHGYSRTETGSAKTNWAYVGVVETWKPGVPKTIRVTTGLTAWTSNWRAHTTDRFPNDTPAIGDMLVQAQYAETHEKWEEYPRPFRSIRVWSGESWEADHEIVGGLLVAGRLASRTNIIADGAIFTSDYRPDDGTGTTGAGAYLSSGYVQLPLTRVTGTLYARNIDANVINAYFFSSNPVTISSPNVEATINKSASGVALADATRAVGVLIYYTNNLGMAVTACRFGTSATFQKTNNVYAQIVTPNTKSPNHTLHIWRLSDSALKVRRTTSHRSSAFTIRYVYWLAIAS